MNALIVLFALEIKSRINLLDFPEQTPAPPQNPKNLKSLKILRREVKVI